MYASGLIEDILEMCIICIQRAWSKFSSIFFSILIVTMLEKCISYDQPKLKVICRPISKYRADNYFSCIQGSCPVFVYLG